MSTLAVLPLQHPLILLPASRITIPVKKELGQQLASLIQESEAQPVLAAVPIVNADSAQGEAPVLNEWGCVARITRLVRPSALNPSETYLVTLHGLTRVRLARPLKLTSNAPEFMPYHPVEYGASQKEGQVPAREAIDAFKRSSLRLLEKLGHDSGKGSRRDAWAKFSSMVDDISDQRAGWLADVMVGSIISEYADRLGAFTFGSSACFSSPPVCMLANLILQNSYQSATQRNASIAPPHSFRNRLRSQRLQRRLLMPSTSRFRSSKRNSSFDNKWRQFNESLMHLMALGEVYQEQ